MRITEKTRYKDILPFMWDAERFEQLKEQIPYRDLKKDFGFWTCGDFVRIIQNDENFIHEKIIGRTKYAVEYLGRLKTFEGLLKNIKQYLERNSTKESEEERQAAHGIEFPTMAEQIFLKVQQRFGLHSFEEVEKVKLTDYMLIVKDESSRHKYEKNLNMVYERKRKLKSKTK